jgi:hypothetical protein
MMTPPWTETALQIFRDEIASLPVRPYHSGLLTLARRLFPDCDLQQRWSSPEWYRPGGVYTADGRLVAHDLEGWLEEQLNDHDNDSDALIEHLRPLGLRTSRHSGRTHYFTCPAGKASHEMIQLEIEELQEVLDRHLISGDSPLIDLEDLLEPMVPMLVDPLPLTPQYYAFGRLTDIRYLLPLQPLPPPGQISAFDRLLKEWSAHSQHDHFSRHWVVLIREHLDRYRNRVVALTPQSIHARTLKPFPWDRHASGAAMAQQLRAYHRAAGYAGAWYFHLVSGGLVPEAIAQQIADDLQQGFDYLPQWEATLLKNWLADPYLC